MMTCTGCHGCCRLQRVCFIRPPSQLPSAGIVGAVVFCENISDMVDETQPLMGSPAAFSGGATLPIASRQLPRCGGMISVMNCYAFAISGRTLSCNRLSIAGGASPCCIAAATSRQRTSLRAAWRTTLHLSRSGEAEIIVEFDIVMQSHW